MPIKYAQRNGRLVYFCDHCKNAEIFSIDDHESFIGRKVHNAISKHLYETHPEVWKLMPVTRKVYVPETPSKSGMTVLHIEPAIAAEIEEELAALSLPTRRERSPQPVHTHIWACTDCGVLAAPADLAKTGVA